MAHPITYASLAGAAVFFFIARRARAVDPADPDLQHPWEFFTSRHIAFSPKGAAYAMSFLLLAVSFWSALLGSQRQKASDALASRVALFPGATFQSGVNLPPGSECTWIFLTSGTAREVVAFHSENASKDGWTVETAGPTALFLSRQTERLAIIVTEDRGSARPRNNIVYQLSLRKD